jgi:predicted  nucleic acid-binding Zn-ribbon protein
MQNIKRIMGQRWTIIEKALQDGKQTKKRIEIGKARDLEAKLQDEMDRLVEWKGKQLERERRREEEIEHFEGELYQEIMNQNLKTIEEHKQKANQTKTDLEEEIEKLKKEISTQEEELRESEERLSREIVSCNNPKMTNKKKQKELYYKYKQVKKMC